MQLQTTLFLVGLATTTLAQSADYPQCIETCIERRPTSSFCSGSETGSALDFCTCQSYSGSLLISCMQDCSESDRAAFAAAAIPESCQDTLFPGVDIDNSGSSSPTPTSAGNTAEEVTEEAAQETAEETTTVVEDVSTTTLPLAPTTIVTTTATSSDAAEETNSETSASSTGDDEASQTADESAAASESGDDDSAAMGLQLPGLLAAGGLLAALIL